MTGRPAPSVEDTVMVVGLGMMGSAVAEVVAAELRPARLVLADPRRAATERVAARLGEWPDVVVEQVEDAHDRLAGAAVVVVAAPWPVVAEVLEATRERRVAVVSITRPPVLVDGVPAELAGRRRGPVLLPVGLEPGLTELVVAAELRDAPAGSAVEVLCGGLTTHRPEGFPYRLLFGGTSVPFAERPSFSVRSGDRVVLRRFDDVRAAELPGLDGLESYHDGMVPWLAERHASSGATIEQRTVRWSGFVDAVSVLRGAGLLGREAVETVDGPVVPGGVVEPVLAATLRRRPEEREVTHLQVVVRSGATTTRTNIWCAEDSTPLASGMACLTALPAVAAMRVVGGLPPGWHRPDDVLGPDEVARLRDDLLRYGARWERETTGGTS